MLLRPTFTQHLAKQLLDCKHINLMSPHGQGRRRTLDDINQVLPTHVDVFQVDLKREQNGYDCLRLHLEAHEENKQGIVILHNFYGSGAVKSSLFQALQQFGLLCVSEDLVSSEHGNHKHDFINVMLPAITKAELMLEFAYRELPLHQHAYSGFADWLLLQDKPYSRLDELADDWYQKELWQA